MSFQLEHKQKFEDLDYGLKNTDELKRVANGGNSILFIYPPDEETNYLSFAKNHYDSAKVKFIDISQLLVDFIDIDGWDSFESLYKDYINTPYELFRDEEDSATDLFDMIISSIEEAIKDDKIPIIIRTGALCGTGIENVNIMEHKVVMNLSKPLILFYPSKIKDESLYFLNFRSASKYRCTVIN